MSSRFTTRRHRRAGLAVVGGAAAAALLSTVSFASVSGLPPVSSAQPKIVGSAEPNVYSRGLAEIAVANGAMPLENPTAAVGYYGYDSDGPLLPAPGDLPSLGHKVEASKTEPDKNTYLVMKGQTGADPAYDYGTHFVFQGHELGSPGYITRINLDADVTHRVTLLSTQDAQANPLPAFDGSTWDPWAKRLLFTSESGSTGGVWQATTGVPSTVDNLQAIIGIGGYEGIQNDSKGNLWIVEDVGGSAGAVNTHAKQPNSFVYRFVPDNPNHLTAGGKLQVLAVSSLQNPGSTIAFHAGQADADILSPDVKDLHTYGKVFSTKFVTIHDTAVDPAGVFNANALAKAAGATPFKRPENGQFRPGSSFREFYFDETGDTNSLTEAGSQYGGFGSVLKLTLDGIGSDTGSLTPLYVGDVTRTGFDNVAFLDKNRVTFVEDAGDGLHTQRNALDSAYILDVRSNYASPATPAPVRWLAEGRDPSATIDSGFSGMAGFQNEGDNEITGIHVSNGDPTVAGILGAGVPNAFTGDWRVFFTQQHGDNTTFEVVRHK
jgi:hypothetical protein